MIFSTNDIDFLKQLMPVQNLRNTFALHYENIKLFLHQIRFETVQGPPASHQSVTLDTCRGPHVWSRVYLHSLLVLTLLLWPALNVWVESIVLKSHKVVS